SEPYLKDMRRLFRNEDSLMAGVRNAEDAVIYVSFWQWIINFFTGRNKPAQILEQTRVLLRDVLWRIKTVPAALIQHQDEFVTLLSKKGELDEFEQSTVEQERQANELIERYNALRARINACQNAINRRRNISDSSSNEADDYMSDDSDRYDSD